MATHRFVRKKARYQQIAENDMADIQSKMFSLSSWMSENKWRCSAGLFELFEEKMEALMALHKINEKISNYHTTGL